nr:reverse transcriptase domain-containing protein [Tanacetum cinerariifolium]
MTSLTNSNLELKHMFGQFMKMNTASSSGSGTLPSNMITNPKEDLKGITTRSETAYQGPTIPTTSSSPVVERETEATKDTMHPTNNGSTKDVQPLVVQAESLILNSEPLWLPSLSPLLLLILDAPPSPNRVFNFPEVEFEEDPQEEPEEEFEEDPEEDPEEELEAEAEDDVPPPATPPLGSPITSPPFSESSSDTEDIASVIVMRP